ncbi:M23 family metallopeptidase [Georgenia sp. AZ-5]|uniref:M23 family metallopeptidase n=1 Tax=Georgenia sp. AZ-5 TaxID=3367526 RepID=UPI0037544352
MPGSAVPAGQAQPLTRRQIREAERAREAAEARAALAVHDALPPAAPERVTRRPHAHAAEAAASALAAQEAERVRAAREATRRRRVEEAAAEARPAEGAAAKARAAEEAAAEARPADGAAAKARAAEEFAAEDRAAEPAAAGTRAARRRALAGKGAVEAAAAPAGKSFQDRAAAAAETVEDRAAALDEDVADTDPVHTTTQPTEVLVRNQVHRSRRELRGHVTRRPQRGGHAPGWAPRAAVLGAMGALTIVAPLTGFAGDPASSAQAQQLVDTEPSLLDHLDEHAAATALSSAPASLLAHPGAASRATILATSRADARQALACTPVDAANGARAAVASNESQIVMPIAADSFRYTSRYGLRTNPLGTGVQFHAGIDLAAPLGTPIHAVADGEVTYVGPGKAGRSSMLVTLKHEVGGRTVHTWYNHMFASGLYVEVGDKVRAGDVIAGVGNNGNSTGPHLHFEVHLDEELNTTEPTAWLRENGAVDISKLC